MDRLGKDISTHIGAGIRWDIDAEFDTQNTVIDNARKLVALSDAAAAALPAARAQHAVLAARHSLANAVVNQSIDTLWPMLATIPGRDPQVDAERMKQWKLNESAMDAMLKAGDEAMRAEAEMSVLCETASSPEVTEARRILEAANDRKILREIVDLDVDAPYSHVKRRVM
jgi:hypothetical protein